MNRPSLVSTDAPNPRVLWWNGKLVSWSTAHVHINSVGHASVSSVFEGIKAYWRDGDEILTVFRLRDHMRRLIESARLARLPITATLDELEKGCIDLLRALRPESDTYIRPWTFANGTIRELIVPENTETSVAIDTWPFRSRNAQDPGCHACVSSWTRIGANALPPQIKAFANYHNARLATVEAKANGYDAPILLNERQKLAEGPGACVMLVRDGVLLTPGLSSGILDSITRSTLIELAADVLKMAVVERDIDRAEIYLANEAFFVGTAWEILPILSVDRLRIGNGRIGPKTFEFRDLYSRVVHGVEPGYSHWCTDVLVPSR